MLVNLGLGFSLMVLCLLFQCFLLMLALRFYLNHHAWVHSPRLGARMLLIMTVMGILVIGNLVQVGVWAWVFLLLGEFNDYATAFYFSGVTFATLGYGDMVMSPQWRILGPLESLNGIFMVGVSTSAMLWTFQDTIKVILKNNHGIDL